MLCYAVLGGAVICYSLVLLEKERKKQRERKREKGLNFPSLVSQKQYFHFGDRAGAGAALLLKTYVFFFLSKLIISHAWRFLLFFLRARVFVFGFLGDRDIQNSFLSFGRGSLPRMVVVLELVLLGG